jgi:hypothetical protein
MNTLYLLNVVLLVLFLWCIPWWMYNRFVRTKEFHPMGTVVLPTPKWLSCAIPYVSTNPKKNKCENVKFDGWSIGHVLIYATVGMVLPGHWVAVLALSVACEAFEYAVGWRARWLIDPIANMVGYMIGHVYYVNLHALPWLSSMVTTNVLAGGMALLLYLNRPAMMPRGEEFI